MNANFYAAHARAEVKGKTNLNSGIIFRLRSTVGLFGFAAVYCSGALRRGAKPGVFRRFLENFALKSFIFERTNRSGSYDRGESDRRWVQRWWRRWRTAAGRVDRAARSTPVRCRQSDHATRYHRKWKWLRVHLLCIIIIPGDCSSRVKLGNPSCKIYTRSSYMVIYDCLFVFLLENISKK